MRLTDARARKLDGKDKRVIVYDDQLAGFGIRVAAGGTKSWIVRYRVGGGRGAAERMMTLGKLELLRADAARKMAQDVLAEARKGRDPLADKRNRRDAPTVNALFERYFEEHAPTKKPRSVEEDRRNFKNHISPTIGSRKAAEIEIDDVSRLHRQMKDRPFAANRVLALLSKAFNLAERWKIRPLNSNPAKHVPKYPEPPRDRYYSIEEVSAIGHALAELAENVDGKPANPFSLLALRLALLLGLRIGEVRDMRWEDVDLEKGLLRLPDSKTGYRTLTLPAYVRALLEEAPRIGACVIPGRDPDTPLDYKAVHKVWVRARDRAGLKNAQIHDMRHTVATMAAETGVGAHLIRDLIGHKTLAMANRYVGRMNAPVRDLREWVANQIHATLLGTGRARGSDRRE